MINLSEAHKAIQSTAEAFANKFTSITGNLSLEREEVVDMVESIYDDSGLTEYVYQRYKFYFASDYSTVKLNLAESIDCPILSGDQEKNYFIVTVRPDCTVEFVDNYLTKASAVQTGQKPALTKEYLQKLDFIFSSLQENDTLIFDEISAYRYDNYFGYVLIEPLIVVKYHYASDPENIMETSFVYNLTWVE